MNRFIQRPSIVFSLALMVGLGVVLSGQTSSPPAGYRLEEVTVEVTRRARPPVPNRHVILKGNGTGEWKEGARQVSTPFPPSDMLALINSLHAIRFFHLPPSYSVSYSAFLRADGTVGLKALKMQDADHTMLCFTAAAYKKCVTFGDGGPPELDRLVTRILAGARKEP